MPTAELLKAAALLGAVLATGGAVFLALVWRPAVAQTVPFAGAPQLDAAVRRRVQALIAAGVLTMLVAAVSEAWRVATFLNLDPISGQTPQAGFLLFVTETGIGRVLMLRPALGLALWGAVRMSGGRLAGVLAVLYSLGLLATFSLASHSAAGAPGLPFAPVLADLVHLGAAAAWYGGLVPLAGLSWRLTPDDRHGPLLGRVVSRFSTLGLLMLPILGLTGALLAARRLYGPLALVEHPYVSPPPICGGCQRLTRQDGDRRRGKFLESLSVVV